MGVRAAIMGRGGAAGLSQVLPGKLKENQQTNQRETMAQRS